MERISATFLYMSKREDTPGPHLKPPPVSVRVNPVQTCPDTLEMFRYVTWAAVENTPQTFRHITSNTKLVPTLKACLVLMGGGGSALLVPSKHHMHLKDISIMLHSYAHQFLSL